MITGNLGSQLLNRRVKVRSHDMQAEAVESVKMMLQLSEDGSPSVAPLGGWFQSVQSKIPIMRGPPVVLIDDCPQS